MSSCKLGCVAFDKHYFGNEPKHSVPCKSKCELCEKYECDVLRNELIEVHKSIEQAEKHLSALLLNPDDECCIVGSDKDKEIILQSIKELRQLLNPVWR